jgi:hypothetical protein
MVDTRTLTLPAIWADDAITEIPTPPIANTTYRNTDLGSTELLQGWPYQKIVDSADFNQTLWLISNLVKNCEQYGIMPWCASTTYKQNGICLASNGIFYWAKKDNTGVNPVTDSGMTNWGVFLDPGDNFVTETVLTSQINLCEKLANKTQSLSSSSTTTQYPSAKAVYDEINNLQNSKQNNITGGASTITTSNLAANRALLSDGSGKVAVSAVTNTELGYLDGVTSNIQTQLNGKQNNITGGASTITTSNLAANRALLSDGSGKVAVSAVTNTELGYLDGVTSNIQTQLNGKQASGSYMTLSGNQTASGNKTFSGQIIRSTAPGASDNSTQVPNTSWVNSRITSIMNTSGIRKANYAAMGTISNLASWTAPYDALVVAVANTNSGRVNKVKVNNHNIPVSTVDGYFMVGIASYPLYVSSGDVCVFDTTDNGIQAAYYFQLV